MRSLGLSLEQHRAYRKAQKQSWYRKNRDISIARSRARKTKVLEWQVANREKVNTRMRQWRRTEVGREKAEYDSLMRRFKKHGLTLDQYHAIVEQQNFSCAICREVPADNYGGLHDGFHIDHHHVTGRVRGLLCKRCNVGIGMLKDSAEVCVQAAAYLTSR